MIHNAMPGGMATAGGAAGKLTSSQVAAIGNGGGAGPVLTLTTTTYAAQATENGYTYTNTASSVNTAVSLPAGLPLGDTRTIYCNSGGGSINFTFAGSEKVQYGGTAGALGGSITGTVPGGSATIKKMSATTWGVIGQVGSVTAA